MVRRDVVGPNALGRLFKHMLVTEWAAPDVIDDLVLVDGCRFCENSCDSHAREPGAFRLSS